MSQVQRVGVVGCGLMGAGIAEVSARVNGAKEALNMDFLSDDRIVFIETEISDLKEAWAEPKKTWR